MFALNAEADNPCSVVKGGGEELLRYPHPAVADWPPSIRITLCPFEPKKEGAC